MSRTPILDLRVKSNFEALLVRGILGNGGLGIIKISYCYVQASLADFWSLWRGPYSGVRVIVAGSMRLKVVSNPLNDIIWHFLIFELRNKP